MAITYKIMKTLTRPDGDNKVRYEVFDRAGRKMIAPDWYEHEDEAFISGQHIVKDGILYRFLIPHTAETAWNSNEVTAVDVGEEIEAIVISLNGKIPTTAKGVANGVAELDSTGKVPAAQLPSYVDDVQEYSDKDHFPVTGSTGVIYVSIDTNKTYRWSGSAYVEISESLALGETSSTAFRGDHGKTAYDHATDANRLTTAQAEGLYKVAVSDEGHVKSVTAVQKEDITNLGIPAQDTTYSPATQSANGLMSSQDKTKLDGIDMSPKVNTSDFYATEMPVSETDSTKVATALSGLKSQIDQKASIIRDTVQNVAIASVPDAASNLPLTALRFAVEPIQAGSGDPYPAGGSPQRWDEEWEVGNYDSETGEKNVVNNQIRSKNYIPVLPSTTYYFKSNSNSRILYYQSDKTYIGSELVNNATFTTPANCAYVNFHLGTAYGTTYKNDVTFNYPSSDTAYHAWQNNRPITGRTSAVVTVTGANLFEDSLTGRGINASGVISTSSNNNLYLGQVKAGVTYTFTTDGGAFAYAFYNSKPQAESASYNGARTTTNTTFTAPIDGWVAVRIANSYLYPMLVVGSTAPSSYTPYTGTQHTVQFGQTVYGCLVDYVNGKAYVTHALATKTGNDVVDVKTASSGIYYALLGAVDGSTASTSASNRNQYKTNMYGISINASVDNALRMVNGSTYAYNSELDTVAKAEAFYNSNPLQIFYPLDTPIEISLSNLDEIRTVEGQMNLWSDSGDIVEMTYPCDTKGYVEKRLSASQNLMELIITANREDGMKATKAYSTGNLLIVNGTLYRATTSIANGATLTPGTNVTATTVAAELAALA